MRRIKTKILGVLLLGAIGMFLLSAGKLLMLLQEYPP